MRKMNYSNIFNSILTFELYNGINSTPKGALTVFQLLDFLLPNPFKFQSRFRNLLSKGLGCPPNSASLYGTMSPYTQYKCHKNETGCYLTSCPPITPCYFQREQRPRGASIPYREFPAPDKYVSAARVKQEHGAVCVPPLSCPHRVTVDERSWGSSPPHNSSNTLNPEQLP